MFKGIVVSIYFAYSADGVYIGIKLDEIKLCKSLTMEVPSIIVSIDYKLFVYEKTVASFVTELHYVGNKNDVIFMTVFEMDFNVNPILSGPSAILQMIGEWKEPFGLLNTAISNAGYNSFILIFLLS